MIRNSVEVRNTLVRLFLFAVPGSILWSLLSLVATEKLGYKERGFGVCLGMIGSGAVLGATFIPLARLRYSSERIVLVAQLLFGLICITIGLTSFAWIIVPSLMLVGSCWMATMTTLNSTAQVYLPRKFRARGMAAYLMSFALAMAIGSATWGWLAYGWGISAAYVIAGITLACVAIGMNSFRLGPLHENQNSG